MLVQLDVRAFRNLEATSQPFGYLVLDYRPETPDDVRIRTHVFGDELSIVYEPDGYGATKYRADQYRGDRYKRF